MNCSQCGSEVGMGASACPNCGALMPTSPPPGASSPVTGTTVPAPPGAGTGIPSGPSRTPGVGTPFVFDYKKLSREYLISGIATLVLLISLFLPWVTVNFGGLGSASASGVDLHGYLWFVFVINLAVLAFLGLKASSPQMPLRLPVPESQALLIATGVQFVIVLLGFIFKGYPSGYGVGYGYGAFVSLVAAIVAVAPFAIPFIQARRMPKGPST